MLHHAKGQSCRFEASRTSVRTNWPQKVLTSKHANCPKDHRLCLELTTQADQAVAFPCQAYPVQVRSTTTGECPPHLQHVCWQIGRLGWLNHQHRKRCLLNLRIARQHDTGQWVAPFLDSAGFTPMLSGLVQSLILSIGTEVAIAAAHRRGLVILCSMSSVGLRTSLPCRITLNAHPDEHVLLLSYH